MELQHSKGVYSHLSALMLFYVFALNVAHAENFEAYKCEQKEIDGKTICDGWVEATCLNNRPSPVKPLHRMDCSWDELEDRCVLSGTIYDHASEQYLFSEDITTYDHQGNRKTGYYSVCPKDDWGDRYPMGFTDSYSEGTEVSGSLRLVAALEFDINQDTEVSFAGEIAFKNGDVSHDTSMCSFAGGAVCDIFFIKLDPPLPVNEKGKPYDRPPLLVKMTLEPSSITKTIDLSLSHGVGGNVSLADGDISWGVTGTKSVSFPDSRWVEFCLNEDLSWEKEYEAKCPQNCIGDCKEHKTTKDIIADAKREKFTDAYMIKLSERIVRIVSAARAQGDHMDLMRAIQSWKPNQSQLWELRDYSDTLRRGSREEKRRVCGELEGLTSGLDDLPLRCTGENKWLTFELSKAGLDREGYIQIKVSYKELVSHRTRNTPAAYAVVTRTIKVHLDRVAEYLDKRDRRVLVEKDWYALLSQLMTIIRINPDLVALEEAIDSCEDWHFVNPFFKTWNRIFPKEFY